MCSGDAATGHRDKLHGVDLDRVGIVTNYQDHNKHTITVLHEMGLVNVGVFFCWDRSTGVSRYAPKIRGKIESPFDFAIESSSRQKVDLTYFGSITHTMAAQESIAAPIASVQSTPSMIPVSS